MNVEIDEEGYFDRVVITDEGAGPRVLNRDEFLRLPLSQRIRCMIQRTASFYAGAREVDRAVALNALRRARIAS